MNLRIRGAGLLGLILLLAVSTASCHGGSEEASSVGRAAGEVKGAIEAIEEGNVPQSALKKIPVDMGGGQPGLVQGVSESKVEQEISAETAGLTPETANRDIVIACKLTDRLPGKESVDSQLVDDRVRKIEDSLRSAKEARESSNAKALCGIAEAMES
jgi:hypothetical protein